MSILEIICTSDKDQLFVDCKTIEIGLLPPNEKWINVLTKINEFSDFHKHKIHWKTNAHC